MADGDRGNGSNQRSSSISSEEKVVRNKRKYLAEFPADVPSDVSLSLTEFPGYELLAEKFQNTLSFPGSTEAQSNWPKEEREVEELYLTDWNDSIAFQLEELLLHNLSATFQSAIQKIAECGYSDEVAECAVLRSGLYYGSKDTVSNIVDGALVFLKREKEYDTSRYHIFEDLDYLVEYTMLEMIYVVREVKPSLTITEAMWFLLICDLNLSRACTVEGNGFGGKEISADSSSDPTVAQLKFEASTSITIPPPHNSTCVSESSFTDTQNLPSEIPTVGGFPKPHPLCPFLHDVRGNSLGITAEYYQSMCQLAAMDEKAGTSRTRKGFSANAKRHMLQQKSFLLEKRYKGCASKGSLRATFTTWSGPVLDEKLKSPPDSSGGNLKNTSSKTSKTVAKDVAVAERNHHLSSNTPSALVGNNKPTPMASKDAVHALPPTKTKLDASLPQETKPIPKPIVSIHASPKTSDYCVGIPYDKSLEMYVPQDEKDKAILVLVQHLQILQKELQGWTDWANQKVMQATRGIKTLRREKEETEKYKKEKQILEENTAKRLSEMDCALANATSQVEVLNSTFDRLEKENTALKKELKAARLQALGSASNFQEALLREKEALKRVPSWDMEKGLLQEEVSIDKLKVAELQRVAEKAKGLYNQIEARHKHEETVKEKLLMEASSIRKERIQLKSLAKGKEDKIRRKAENEMQKYEEDIEKLKSKISELRLESESSKIAALRRGIDGSNGSYVTKCKDVPASQGHQTPKSTKRLSIFRDNFRATNARADRECVMCLTEEMQVVFLPCAHQALCANCNELHEKQGMNDCPSCRTPIKRRINVRFASP